MVLESYFKFSDSYKLSNLLELKVPDDIAIEYIKIKKNLLFRKIMQLSTDDKFNIENTIDDILNLKNIKGVKNIKSISQILYFIDLSFIKMMAPNYKDQILTY